MRKKTIALLLILFVTVILAATCTSCGTKSVQIGSSQQPCDLPKATTTPAVTGSGALIVTDISGSMNGFVLPNSTRLFTVHDMLDRSVRNSIANAEPTPTIRRCYLGSDLNCQLQIPIRDLDKASTYSAKESHLDLFMRVPQQGDSSNNSSKTPEDPIDPYRIAVLITDGMEAQSPDSKNGAAPCLAGADPDCMAYLLQQRAQQGYGIWVALLLLPFRGNHYAERPLDDSHWQRIQQHVSQLGQDPYFQGVKFSVKRAGQTVPFTSYQFEGVKPVMVLALSKDIQAGRSFIKQFSDSIKRERVVQPESAVYTAELAPLAVIHRQVTKISLATSGKVQGARPIAGNRENNFYDYLIECDRNGVATLSVNSEAGEGVQMVPEGVKVDYNLVPLSNSTLPQNDLTISNVQDKNYEMQLTCQQIREGKYSACLSLQADLKLDPSSNAFWTALHADNMYEAPERLYGLRDMIQKVLEAVTKQPRFEDRIFLRVERK